MKRLVTISPFVPYEGVDHAGGEYLLRYLEEAERFGWQVSLICPRTPDTVRDRERAPDWLSLTLSPHEPRVGRVRLAWRLLTTGAESRSPATWWDRLNADARAILSSATVIDLQWSQSIFYSRSVRARLPDLAMVGTAHDILTESLDRRRKSPVLTTRIMARLAWRAASRNEIGGMNACDRLYVFKQEDVDALARLGVRCEVRTTCPYVNLPDDPPRPDPSSNVIVFAGAFWREENAESARWFLTQVWPRIGQRRSDAIIRFAGSRPPQWLSQQVAPNVEVTGYLDDLIDAYRGAALVVAPLTRGAGIKFKVLQAIALGFPVVGTSVASEGIASLLGDQPVDVHNDPGSFADAVISALGNLETRITEAGKAAMHSRERLDFAHNVRAQLQEYEQLSAGRA